MTEERQSDSGRNQSSAMAYKEKRERVCEQQQNRTKVGWRGRLTVACTAIDGGLEKSLPFS